jgi:hypothetical protein
MIEKEDSNEELEEETETEFSFQTLSKESLDSKLYKN